MLNDLFTGHAEKTAEVDMGHGTAAVSLFYCKKKVRNGI
jgi:hypothetical protein